MEFTVHETSRGSHLLKGAGETLGSNMVIVGMVHLEIHSPNSLEEVRILFEGFPMVLLEGSHEEGSPLSTCWWGCSSRVTSKLAASSSSGLGAVASWSNSWHCPLVLVGGAGVLDTVGEEAVNGGSLPTVASCGVVDSMVASGKLPVWSSRGYISTPMSFEGTGPQGSATGLHKCVVVMLFLC